jgi:hypothetical protein
VRHLIDSVESSLISGNAYAALALSLALPDICGWITDPSSSSRRRYTDFFSEHLKQHYVLPANGWMPERVFLTADDFYSLRCAYLHEGRDDITEQRCQEVLTSFQFLAVPVGSMVHNNRNGSVLQLQIDIFCRQILAGAIKAMDQARESPTQLPRLQGLLLVRRMDGAPV